MAEQTSTTNTAATELRNHAKDKAHDAKNNVKDAYHEVKTGMEERKAEDAAAKREHETARRTGSPEAAMRAQPNLCLAHRFPVPLLIFPLGRWQ